MGKKKDKDNGRTFPEMVNGSHVASRKRRSLILPKLLEARASDNKLRGSNWDRAREILGRWADLAESGRLARMTESQIKGDFLREVFGDALQYKRFAEGEAEWNMQPEYATGSGPADAAIGFFGKNGGGGVRVIVEVKGPGVNLDRDRSNGRTAVQQLWDYLNAVPGCSWGIVTNVVSFRLYHRDRTPHAFEEFLLQDFSDESMFARFWCLLQKAGLLDGPMGEGPRAGTLLEETGKRQDEVGTKLYDKYHQNRLWLIDLLKGPKHGKPLETAIRITQKLLDRIIFVAFCEDRGLLPPSSIEKAFINLPPFRKATNPRWQNFLELFRSIDEGNEKVGIPRYNGGLFHPNTEVDDLDLDDDCTDFFREVGGYDFRDELNVDVLGHLFEQSINDIEKIRKTGLYEKGAEGQGAAGKMEKSAQRKRAGIYYTPAELTGFIVKETVGRVIGDRFAAVAAGHGITPDRQEPTTPDARWAAYWKDCFQVLQEIKVCDPACGSGAFLIQAYELFEEEYERALDSRIFHEEVTPEDIRYDIPGLILRKNLFGVDLSPEGVEITQLALWIRTAERGKTLEDLSRNIVFGNSIVSDRAVDERAINWKATFPEVFGNNGDGFDCVIGNPPWERLKVQEREFFDEAAPRIASAVSAATRRKMIAGLQKSNPELHTRYQQAQANAEKVLEHVRSSGAFPLTGKGDINTYAVFAELAKRIVNPRGRVGILVPSGIATDHSTRKFFEWLMKSKSLSALYDFENKLPLFPDVHRSFKFCVLLFGGDEVKTDAADFVFFAHEMGDLKQKDRHIELSEKDIRLLNPNTRTCPIFRTRRDAEITRGIYRRVPVLVDRRRKEGGNPWDVKFLTMFHQTNDAELFVTAEELKKKGFRREGNRWKRGKVEYLPLYEAKMIQAYDHRAASVVVDESNWMRQGQTEETSLVQHQNPEFTIEPRWWVGEADVMRAVGGQKASLLGFKDITSATNQRTVIAAWIPWAAVTNHFPLVLAERDPKRMVCLLANLNTFVFDYATRQKVGAVTLNFFIVEQLPTLPPDRYQDRCLWEQKVTLEDWVSQRVLKLTCTSNDMVPLAEAAGFKEKVHRWDPEERAQLMAELDAAYFILYGVKRPDVEYILSTFTGVARHDQTTFGFGGGTAQRVLKAYDELMEKAKQG